MIIHFKIEDKISRPRFFQKTFLLIDIKFIMILKIIFLEINNANAFFNKKTLT